MIKLLKGVYCTGERWNILDTMPAICLKPCMLPHALNYPWTRGGFSVPNTQVMPQHRFRSQRSLNPKRKKSLCRDCRSRHNSEIMCQGLSWQKCKPRSHLFWVLYHHTHLKAGHLPADVGKFAGERTLSSVANE